VWVVWLGLVIIALAGLYALSTYLDRRAIRHGRRPWSRRPSSGLLRRAGRASAMNSPVAFLSDTRKLGDFYDADDGQARHPNHPRDLAP